MTNQTMHLVLWDSLEALYETNRNLFQKAIDEFDKIRDHFDINRTFRRTSNARTTSVGLSITDREVVERWSERRNAAMGGKTNLPMRLTYAQHQELNENFRRYTQVH